MNKWQLLFCKTVLKLDRVPRYGRLYELTKIRDVWPEKPKPIWRYQRHGMWGFRFLDRKGLLWPYIYATNPGLREWEQSPDARREC